MHTDEESILGSWHRNAQAWTQAVREAGIESRRVATDQAIIDAILDGRPRTVLDMGCGEGWLVRALTGHGISATGIDAVPALIESARAAGAGRFEVADYEDIITGRLSLQADAVACNFSLLGDSSVARLLAALPALLTRNGRLIVQTVHPVTACGEQPYVDGWRVESWSGFGAAFAAPSPWYFRTLSSWVGLIRSCGWDLHELREPLHPRTGRPASAIFMAMPR